MVDRTEAHHLRDLLTAARGYLQLIARELEKPDADHERLVDYGEKAERHLAELDALLATAMGLPPPADE
jgi:hypothetical protein